MTKKLTAKILIFSSIFKCLILIANNSACNYLASFHLQLEAFSDAFVCSKLKFNILEIFLFNQ